MKSTDSMFSLCKRLQRRAPGTVLACAIISALSGCEEKLRPPVALTSPFDRPQLWAVAPFVNESGASIVPVDRVADGFVEQVQDITGINALPLNRVLAAMRRLQMHSVATSADAFGLMNALGVDGLIVGTVTAYDPYSPPKFGAAIQLYRREWPDMPAGLDPIALSRARTETVSLSAMPPNGPEAQAAAVFDATNHQTLAWLDEYSTGRSVPNSAFGKKIYLVKMELYTQFAAYRLLHDLLEVERSRLAPAASQPEAR